LPLAGSNGAIAETKERIRGIQDDVETLDQRVARLEAENVRLQAQIDSKTIDMTAFVQWLASQVQAQIQSGGQSRSVLPDSVRAMLPEPIAQTLDVIDAEFVTVPAKDEDPKT